MHPDIVESMKPLFEEARLNNLLFRSNYQDIIFSPDELEKEQTGGHFCWGAVNWELVSPFTEHKRLLEKVESAQTQADNFRQKYIVK